MKKAAALIVVISMLALLTAGSFADSSEIAETLRPITVTVDGDVVEFDTEPVIRENRTLVPMRAIFEKIGAKVDWNEKDRKVSATKIFADNSFSIIFIEIGKSEMLIGHNAAGSDEIEGTSVELDCAPVIIDSRTLVPLRAISEALGCDVSWNEEERKVIINSGEKNNAGTGDYVSEIMEKLPDNVNYVISPVSLKIAMMMAANGAEGETAEEILKAFGVTDVDSFNAYVKEFTKRLNSTENGEVSIADAIWFNKDIYKGSDGVGFSDEFKKIISEYYDGKAETVSNKNSVEAPNEWVEEKTKGKIKDLIPESAREYLAVLINAIYMNADWVCPFEKGSTFEETFTDINGEEQSKQFMHQTDRFDYFENGETKMIRMPYRNGLEMYVVLGSTRDFSENRKKMSNCKVFIAMPKFKTEYSISFKDVLGEMGVTRAFSDTKAQFGPMFTGMPDPAKIDDVIQKAFIEVDEKGTEAAAATAVIMVAAGAMPMPEKIYEFIADKPFTYFISDRESGEILFAGRYVK